MRMHNETWLYRCVKEHSTYLPSHSGRRPKVSVCDVCGRDAFWVNQDAPMIGGCGMNDYTHKQFRYAFDKKTRDGLHTVKDVDRALDGFHAKYPHLKRPDICRSDPCPSVKLKDAPDNHAE